MAYIVIFSILNLNLQLSLLIGKEKIRMMLWSKISFQCTNWGPKLCNFYVFFVKTYLELFSAVVSYEGILWWFSLSQPYMTFNRNRAKLNEFGITVNRVKVNEFRCKSSASQNNSSDHEGVVVEIYNPYLFSLTGCLFSKFGS